MTGARRSQTRGTAVVGALLALGFAGCPGAVEDPGRFAVDPATCAEVEGRIFAGRCAGAACHEQRKPAAGLDLASSGIFARLGAMQSEACGRRKIVDPASPEQSFLLHKLAEDVGCGERMPLGRKALTAEEIGCVVRWIERGGDAKDGGSPAGDGGRADGAQDGGVADRLAAEAAVADAGEGG